MIDLLWLIPALPFAGFLVLILAGSRLPRIVVAVLGAGSVGFSAVVACLIGIEFISSPLVKTSFTRTVWTWMSFEGFSPSTSFCLDSLSLLMVLVVTVVGFLIHLYSVEFMADDDAYHRYFAYMNLFVTAMLVLVLADNLMLLYLGWEGVGLCSYLLIGFWYKDPVNARAAMKAFVMTRIGDTGMIVGLFLLYNSLGTLEIHELMVRAVRDWPVGSVMATVAAALLLCGALGKSAQLPLQTWLPDAMAGPTPVSALIHAATMVTAGVYLIARTHELFALAPAVQAAVAVIGVATLLVAGFSALAQQDLKRVLAYSTISQIGYMFLALGVGAWSAAMFHFAIHAFFKSLLFLGAGAIIMSTHHEQNMFRLGGLRTQLPVTFWTFLAGAASLAALPLITSGFYSKDAILWYAWSSEKGSVWLWLGGVAGALLTSIYTFRMVFLIFFGEARTKVYKRPGTAMLVPLIVLAVLSMVAGFIELPHTLGDVRLFSGYLGAVLPPVPIPPGQASLEGILGIVAAAVSVVGICLAYLLFLKVPQIADRAASTLAGRALHRLWLEGCGFDWLYQRLLVFPFVTIARINRSDFIDFFYQLAAFLAEGLHQGLSATQTGRTRHYAVGIGVGALIIIGMAVWL
ncbi:MAG: NADH-quinone oxidoreductase subunit L [Desulfomonile tiedjei]|nr:NADH-quinone oxidoreductase subunit L [Desulfomonile tiedjei]